MSEYTNIIAAVDLSPAADPVARRAARLAEQCAARLTLLHVFEFTPPLDLADSPLGSAGWAIDEQELLDLHRRQLDTLVGRLQLGAVRQEVLTGLAKTEIVRFAESEGADLLVVGTHGRHGLGLLLGSTSNAVLHRAPCDVLAVRIRD